MWPDVDYHDEGLSWWLTAEHLRRTLLMATALRAPGSVHTNSTMVRPPPPPVAAAVGFDPRLSLLQRRFLCSTVLATVLGSVGQCTRSLLGKHISHHLHSRHLAGPTNLASPAPRSCTSGAPSSSTRSRVLDQARPSEPMVVDANWGSTCCGQVPAAAQQLFSHCRCRSSPLTDAAGRHGVDRMQ
jgi:hypothetical protein